LERLISSGVVTMVARGAQPPIFKQKFFANAKQFLMLFDGHHNRAWSLDGIFLVISAR